jgi:hypothetical protein
MGSIQDRLQAMENGLNAPTTVPEIGMLLTPFGYDSSKTKATSVVPSIRTLSSRSSMANSTKRPRR